MAGAWSKGEEEALAARGIVNTNIWTWAAFAVTGAIVYGFIPRRDKAVFLFMVMLGGLVYLQRNGGIQGLVETLTSGSVHIPVAKKDGQ